MFSGYFPGVWVLTTDVSEHCVGSIFNRWWSENGDRLEISRIYTGKGEVGKSGPGQLEVRSGVEVLGVKKACVHAGGGVYKSLCTIGVIGLAWLRLSPFTLHYLLKMEPTQCSETSAFNTQKPRKYPEDIPSLQQHGESLKIRNGLLFVCLVCMDTPVCLWNFNRFK
jgi:hypothetical protein